jgi:hypothetical protein
MKMYITMKKNIDTDMGMDVDMVTDMDKDM